MISMGVACLVLGTACIGLASPGPGGWAGIYLLNLFGMAIIVIGIGRLVTGQTGGFALTSRYFYSLSRVQMAGWTIVVLATLLTVAALRGFGLGITSANPGAAIGEILDIAIPGELLSALGIAVFTTAAAPALLALKGSQQPTTDALASAMDRQAGKTPTDASTLGNVGNILVRTKPEQASWRDLVTGDEVATAGLVDISQVQQLLITALLLVTYIGMVVSWIYQGGPVGPETATLLKIKGTAFQALPVLSQSFIGLMAVSHAGYLGFKAVPKVAPEK